MLRAGVWFIFPLSKYTEGGMPVKLVWFGDVSREQVDVAGGKRASLSEMVRAELLVPPGFIICADSYKDVIKENDLTDKIKTLISGINVDDNKALEEESEKIRQLIKEATIPDTLLGEIIEAYRKLGDDSVVAVRSSATMEDLSDASFAGQQETFLFVRGEDELVRCVRECWASLYNSRVIFYRSKKRFNEDLASIAVVVQQMIDAEKSGVMFTVNPITKDHNALIIEAAWGTGEGIVSGLVTPDSYCLDKNCGDILDMCVCDKELMVVCSSSMQGTDEVEVPADKVSAQVLTEMELLELLSLGKQLEKVYGTPQDVEWCISEGVIYLLQSRAITTL
jgi:pyruvate,water dikinase